MVNGGVCQRGKTGTEWGQHFLRQEQVRLAVHWLCGCEEKWTVMLVDNGGALVKNRGPRRKAVLGAGDGGHRCPGKCIQIWVSRVWELPRP